MREVETTGYPQFIFDPVQDPTDRQLLGSVTLMGAEDPRLENTEWLEYMKRCVEIGSRSNSEVGTRQAAVAGILSTRQTQQARRQFEHEIGSGNPNHRLHSIYSSPNIKTPLPGRLLHTVATLDEIMGDGVGAISATNGLIRITGKRLRQRCEYVERLGGVLGWEGNTQALLFERPYLLLKSPVRWLILARIAARHGAPGQTKLSPSEASKLMNEPLESHLLAAVEDEEYMFGSLGSRPLQLAEANRQIYEALADTATAERVGEAVVRTYRKYRPDKKAHEKEAAAHYVTGQEGWLSTVRTANNLETPELAAKLNALIHIGGQRLRGHKDETPAYTAIVDARLNLFKELGLIKPQSKTYDLFLGFLKSRPGLVNSKVLITVCKQLKAHGVSDPLGVVRNCFTMLTQPDRLEDQLAAIYDCGIQPQQALRYYPSLLWADPDKIKKIVHTQRIPARVKATTKVTRMASYIPKNLEDKPSDEAFDPLRYRQDYALLYLVTGDTSKLKDPDWLHQMMQYVKEVPRLRPRKASAETLADIESMKHHFAEEIGLTDPHHPLAQAYARRGSSGIVPQALLDTVQALQELTGNALGTVIQDKRLLSCSSERLYESYQYIKRLATALRWDGNVQSFIQKYPTALDIGNRHRIILAQLAGQHGTRADAKLDGEDIMTMLAAPPETHLIELLQNPGYRFGNRLSDRMLDKVGIPQARQEIHQAIATSEGAARLGRRVVKAYLRFHPLPGHADRA